MISAANDLTAATVISNRRWSPSCVHPRVLKLIGLLIVATPMLAGCIGDVTGEEEDESYGTTEDELTSCTPTEHVGDGPYNRTLPNPDDRHGNRAYRPGIDHSDPEALRWPIKHGTHLLDGLGKIRGVIPDDAVEVNYGQKKTIKGHTHVYAFYVHLEHRTC